MKKRDDIVAELTAINRQQAGAIIKEYISKRETNQLALAATLGVSRKTISQLVTGRQQGTGKPHQADYTLVKSVCVVLGISDNDWRKIKSAYFPKLVALNFVQQNSQDYDYAAAECILAEAGIAFDDNEV